MSTNSIYPTELIKFTRKFEPKVTDHSLSGRSLLSRFLMIDHKYIEFPFADFLLVFISIVVGYVVTEFFAGWGGMIRNRNQVKVYWLHIGWTINFFLQLIVNWWWLWGNRLKITENISYFLFTLASPFIFYVISVFLFPTIKENKVLNYRTYFYKSTRYIFLIFSMLMFVYLMNNIWLKDQPLFSIDNQFAMGGFVSGLVFSYLKNEILHIFSFILECSFFLLYVLNSTVQ